MSMMIAMPAGCWDLDLATGNLSLCRHSRRMFGLSPESSKMLAENEWADRIHPDDLTVVRQALTECLVHQTPYAERFRTIHPDGSLQWVLGVGGPIEHRGKYGRFVGWNFDVVSAGELAGEWISLHPQALSAEHLVSIQAAQPRSGELSADTNVPEALLTRAQSILRVRRARERLFGRAMIGEPAFDLLLSMYLRSGEREISLSSLAKSADIPHSSAMRWIAYLADKGFVARRNSDWDRRAISIQLTASGRAALDEFLAVR